VNITIKGLKFSYTGSKTLNGLDLEVEDSEMLGLVGPTSNLDMRHQLEVMEVISALVKDKMISAVMALHDLNLAAMFVDKLVILKGGKIFRAGKPADLLNPENIREVYGVEVVVMNSLDHPYIIPIRSIGSRLEGRI
jgi:iron complex transport system ATP-binding protein